MNIELIIDFFLSRENWKDFIIPSLAIAIPIFITLIITHLDRKTNAKNRLEDLAQYEKDKIKMLLKLERLSENSSMMLNAIKSGMTTHVSVLIRVKQFLDNESL
ncbi:hypothetical protein [Sphingobacterium sp. HMA12]|uniref:hypothetical protein n=1 Tax=Sphingobacterium sp. HMA12 TaxID=2050894 RepID=UPI000CEA66EB|nr:hypothetical protein [Sphingobacterium sp. HMA12]